MAILKVAEKVLAFPGETVPVRFKLENTESKTITGIIVNMRVFIGESGTDSWTFVDLGYAVGNEGAYADFSVAPGKSKEISGFVTVPESIKAAFDKAGSRSNGEQGVQPYYYVRYKDGTEDSWTTILGNIHFLNHRYAPAVRSFELERAADGVQNDEGESLLTTLKLALSDSAKTDFMGLTLYYAENEQASAESAYIDLTANIPALLDGAADDPALVPDAFSNGSNWNFLLVFGDEYESYSARLNVPRAFANLHLSGKSTGGACFGGFSSSGEGDPKLESHYPAYFYKGIDGVTNFSAEESCVGTWIDGKPLYTRILTKLGAEADTIHVLATMEEAETLWIDPSASFCVNSNGYVYPVSHTSSSGARTFVAHYYGTDKEVRAGSYTGDSADIYVKVYYTKTSDTATA